MNAIAPAAALNPVARLASQALRALEAVLGVAGAALLAVLLLLVMASVVLRYGFGTGWVGAEDAAIWLHVALIAVGAPLALHSTLALRLVGVRDRLPDWAQPLADGLADAYVLLSALVIALGGSRMVGMIGGTSPALGLPQWLRFALFAGSGVLMLALVLLRHLALGRVWSLLCAVGLAVLAYGVGQWGHWPLDAPSSLVLAVFALLGLLVGAPLPHAFLAAAYLAIPFGSSLPEPALVHNVVTGMSRFLLLAIPFFLLAGVWLTQSGMAARLVRLSSALVGHWRGGLAQTTLLSSVLFSGASGSSVANAAFGTATFYPELVRHGYRPERAGAIVAATAVLDNVIPPSIAFLMLAAATQLSVGRLLVGGVLAGLVMAVMLGLAMRLTAPCATQAGAGGTRPRADGAQVRSAAVAAIPALGLGGIVVLGIRMGVVTTTEAAAVAACYTLLLGWGARLGWRGLYHGLRQAAGEAAAIGMLIGTAGPLAFALAVDGLSSQWVAMLAQWGTHPAWVLLLICGLLLLLGLVLDTGAAILLLAPLLLPLAVQAGIDPVAFGVIVVVTLMIGGLTPPCGMLILVVSGLSGVPAGAMFRAVWPYVLALLAALALLCATALWLPPLF